jgi:hypothetical protein
MCVSDKKFLFSMKFSFLQLELFYKIASPLTEWVRYADGQSGSVNDGKAYIVIVLAQSSGILSYFSGAYWLQFRAQSLLADFSGAASCHGFGFSSPQPHWLDSIGPTNDTLDCNIEIVLNSQVMQRFEWPIVNNEETAKIISPRVKGFRAG